MPVTYSGRSNMGQRRPFQEKAASGGQERVAQSSALVVAGPRLDRVHEEFVALYQPEAAFLTHLIATRDEEQDVQARRNAALEMGASRYRETAASPRKRPTGYLLSTSL